MRRLPPWTGAIPLLFPAVFLYGRELASDQYLDKALEAAGGARRFERVETLQGRFTLIRPSTTAVRPLFVDFAARRSPDGRWSVREVLPGNRIVAWPLSDESTGERDRGADAAALAERFFWLRGAQSVKERGGTPRYAGLGYLQDRLVRRVEFRGPAADGVLPPGNFTLYFDTDTFQLRGAGWAGPAAGSLWFEGHELFQNQIVVPLRWTRLSSEGKPVEILKVDALVINGLIDEALFRPGGARGLDEPHTGETP